MKPTLRMNGQKMVTLNISFNLGVEDFAGILAGWMVPDEKLPGRKAIIEIVRDYLIRHGRPGCSLLDRVDLAVYDRCLAHCKKLFPKFIQ